MAPQPAAGAARAPPGRLRRQGDAAHHAAQGDRHRGHRGAGADALHRAALAALSPKAAIPLFDHGIAYLPGSRRSPGIGSTPPAPRAGSARCPRWTRARSRSSSTRARQRDQHAAGSPDEHGVDATWTIKLTPSGAGDLGRDRAPHRRSAFELRRNLGEKDARAQWVEQYLPRAGSPRSRSARTSTSRPISRRAPLAYATARTPRASRAARATSWRCRSLDDHDDLAARPAGEAHAACRASAQHRAEPPDPRDPRSAPPWLQPSSSPRAEKRTAASSATPRSRSRPIPKTRAAFSSSARWCST